MLKGVTLNGVPLDLDASIDLRIKTESFSFHYLYRPAEKGTKKSSSRSGRVKHLTKEEYLNATKEK